jgi:hypothetical protein
MSGSKKKVLWVYEGTAMDETLDRPIRYEDWSRCELIDWSHVGPWSGIACIGVKKSDPCEWWQEAPLSGKLQNCLVHCHGENFNMGVWNGGGKVIFLSPHPTTSNLYPLQRVYFFILFCSTEFGISSPRFCVPARLELCCAGSINNSLPAGSERQMSPRVVQDSPPCVSLSAIFTSSLRPFIVPSRRHHKIYTILRGLSPRVN